MSYNQDSRARLALPLLSDILGGYHLSMYIRGAIYIISISSLALEMTATTLLLMSKISPPDHATRSRFVFTSSPSRRSRLLETSPSAVSLSSSPPASIATHAASNLWNNEFQLQNQGPGRPPTYHAFLACQLSSIPRPTVTLFERSRGIAAFDNGRPGSLQQMPSSVVEMVNKLSILTYPCRTTLEGRAVDGLG